VPTPGETDELAEIRRFTANVIASSIRKAQRCRLSNVWWWGMEQWEKPAY